MGRRGKCNERRHFFSNRVVPVYNSLPHDIAESSTLSEFRAKLDRYVDSNEPSPLSRVSKKCHFYYMIFLSHS